MSDSQIPDQISWPPLEPEDSGWKSDRVRLPLPLIILAVGGIILIVIFAIILFKPSGDDKKVKPTLNPTVLSEYAVPPSDSLISDSGTPQPSANIPISMTLKGIEMPVLPYQVKEDGAMHYPSGQSGTAVWAYGTIINFVVGLEQTKANTALMESLVPGDQITLTMSNESVYRFGYSGRGELATSGIDIYRQNKPGLTLISLGGDQDTRLVVYGEYLGVAAEGESSGAAQAGYSIGEPAALGDVRVTVLGASYLFDDPAVPKGWAFYLVDYQIDNLSQEVLDPNRFRMELQDGVGNTYSLNLPASEAGTFGFLSWTIPPNTVAQGTAGYLVPAPLQGPKLKWSFSRLGEPDNVVKVMIDFTSPEETIEPAQLAVVELTKAELSGDRTLLSVWGTIVNNSEEVVEIAGDQVSLMGGDAEAAIRAADPALPWSIGPGSVLSFQITFQRPNSSSAILTVLNQPYEITGFD